MSFDGLLHRYEAYGLKHGGSIPRATAFEIAKQELGDGYTTERAIMALTVAGFKMDPDKPNQDLYITNAALAKRRKRATKKQNKR